MALAVLDFHFLAGDPLHEHALLLFKLLRAVAAALILYCLEHGIEPCWDAANEPSAALARQLGFHSTGKYEAYRLKPPEGKSAVS
ncbi:MAG: GNAT family N-acetyltransferase [Deltaproteobacteria bacterium]|nr:GNAT family N-acetyltransferase [Deltaproteobacteria bacterium]